MPDPEKLKKWNLKPYVPPKTLDPVVVAALEYSRKWDEAVKAYWKKRAEEGHFAPPEYYQ